MVFTSRLSLFEKGVALVGLVAGDGRVTGLVAGGG
jgi:hypothetical protein